MVIDCKKISKSIFQDNKKNIEIIKSKGINPKIVVINLNNNFSNNKYIEQKTKYASELSVNFEVITHLKTQEELLLYIKKLNKDPNIHGYLIQLPLPEKFDESVIFEHIDISKDLDGLSSLAISRYFSNSNLFTPIPCVVNAVMHVIKNQRYNLVGKNVVILNRSMIIGKPLSIALLKENATVTICHSHTKKINECANKADLLIVGIGKPLFIKKRMVKMNSFIIDVGFNFLNNKIVGDVDFEQVKNQAKYITTVPNGIGKLTVGYIFKNLVDLINYQLENRKI